MLFIYCAGSVSSEIKDIALRKNFRSNDLIFVDDINEYTSCPEKRKTINFNKMCSIYKEDDSIVIANGEPLTRSKIYKKLKEKSLNLSILIDKSAIISSTALIEEGTIVFPFCSVSSNTHLKHNSLINNHSVIGHDAVIGENTVLSSMVNVGGHTKIGNNTYIGMGSSIRDRLKICDNCIVSMGSSVFNDVKKDMIVMGNPARAIRRNEDQKVFKSN